MGKILISSLLKATNPFQLHWLIWDLALTDRKYPMCTSRVLKAPHVASNNNFSISSIQLSNPGNKVTSVLYRSQNLS